jgi:hypothetical protein
MAVPQARRDGYGRPLPELTDAAREPLGHLAQNQDVRKEILSLLEEKLHVLLRRGVFAEVTMTARILDGCLQMDLDVAVTQHYRSTPRRGH